MADDPKKQKQDRKLVSQQPYEVAYFAKKHGISPTLARIIITHEGPSRKKCDAAARMLAAKVLGAQANVPQA